MTFAECIRLRRTELNLTQAAAAAVLSVSRRTIQHWEDPRRPAPHVLAQEGALARLDAERLPTPASQQDQALRDQ